MGKSGSRYLQYALKVFCKWYPTFAQYFDKNRSEGKHYNVAISNSVKKLFRLIFAMQKSGQPYFSKT